MDVPTLGIRDVVRVEPGLGNLLDPLQEIERLGDQFGVVLKFTLVE
jgi:hypothetical protein